MLLRALNRRLARLQNWQRVGCFAFVAILEAIFFSVIFTQVIAGSVPGFVPFVATLTGVIISVPLLLYFEMLIKRLAIARSEAESSKADLAIKVEELAIAKALAIEANRAKSSFLAQMSHELRTPLNAIIGFSSVLTNQADGDESIKNIDTTSYANHIYSSGHLLLSLVNDLLDLAKIESGDLKLHLLPLDMVEIVGDVLGAIKPMADERQQTIRLSAPDEIRFLEADSRATTQILMNLVSNAIKYSPVGSKIDVEVVYSADAAILHICDEGPGMSEEEARLAVEPYARLEHEITRESDGTGLGLPIVNALVALHGGTLSLKMRETGGTRATVMFPRLMASQLQDSVAA